MSPFSPRSLDVDVVLDLMIHDLQILHSLDPSPVREVRAVGIDVLSDRVDIADARIELESGCVANLTASRVSAERVRQLRIFFEDRYFSLDYQKQTVRGARRVRGDNGGGARTPRRPAGRRAGSWPPISRWNAASRFGSNSKRFWTAAPAARPASSTARRAGGRSRRLCG